MAIFQDDDAESLYSHEHDSTAAYQDCDEFDMQQATTVVRQDRTPLVKQTPVAAHHDPPRDRRRLIWQIKNAGYESKLDDFRPSRADTDLSYGYPNMCEISISRQEQEQEEHAEIAGMEIERPKSALHSGDFHEKMNSDNGTPPTVKLRPQNIFMPLSTFPPLPWHMNTEETFLRSRQKEGALTGRPRAYPAVGRGHGQSRDRSNSTIPQTSGFIYKAPTSPLVQSSRPDTPEGSSRRHSRSPDRLRRHTFSPPSLQHFHTDMGIPNSISPGFKTTEQPHQALPWQAHQPRRSFNLCDNGASIFLASRRISLSESPLHHAPMVGSYEESILRGRMSTTPSPPLDFVAQIGVLGKGKCKSNLRCPPHASIPFPAVFYSYESGSNISLIGKQPSPYVGLIDIENGIPPVADKTDRLSKRTSRSKEVHGSPYQSESLRLEARSVGRSRFEHKIKMQTNSPKTPPGGSYRIPGKGQLQIIIKNPNKTAVKLFLIPYDVTDMQAGQKTFIRQRSYSAGPLIDMPLSARRNFGTDRPEAALNASDDPQERPMLRYLIHLNICCTSEGRFYLYKSIRVVFANRVLDGKEKLRNEIQFPEPRYSDYRPTKNDIAADRTSMSRTQFQKDDRDIPETVTESTSRKRTIAQGLPFPGQNTDCESFPQTLFSEQTQGTQSMQKHHQATTMTQEAPPLGERCDEIDSPLSDRSRFSYTLNFEKARRGYLQNEGRHTSLLSQHFKDSTASPPDKQSND